MLKFKDLKVGNIYQYKEGGVIAMVKVVDNMSNDEYYKFRIIPLKSTHELPVEGFIVSQTRKHNADMLSISFYEFEAYRCTYNYFYE